MQCLFYKTILPKRKLDSVWSPRCLTGLPLTLSSADSSAVVQNWSPRQTVGQHAHSMAPVTPTASRESPAGLGECTPTPTHAAGMLLVRALGNVEHLWCIVCKENKCRRYFSQSWFRWGLYCSALSPVNWLPFLLLQWPDWQSEQLGVVV